MEDYASPIDRCYNTVPTEATNFLEGLGAEPLRIGILEYVRERGTVDHDDLYQNVLNSDIGDVSNEEEFKSVMMEMRSIDRRAGESFQPSDSYYEIGAIGERCIRALEHFSSEKGHMTQEQIMEELDP